MRKRLYANVIDVPSRKGHNSNNKKDKKRSRMKTVEMLPPDLNDVDPEDAEIARLEKLLGITSS